MPSTAANAVSKYLRRKGFSRANALQRHNGRSNIEGFEVRAEGGKTVVRYLLGADTRAEGSHKCRARVSERITAMEKALSQRYTVITFGPATGEDYVLTIKPKEH